MGSAKTDLFTALRESIRKMDLTQIALSKKTSIPQNTISMFLHGKIKELGWEYTVLLCRHFGIDPNTGAPLATEPKAIPVDLIMGEPGEVVTALSIPVLGYVDAGRPGAPTDSVMINGELDKLSIHAGTWRMLFPGIEPEGLVALRVSGTSMEPFHCEGDTIFLRRAEDPKSIMDGQKVVVFLPGDGHTFKIWRDSGVLEGINHTFKPIRATKGTRLWGIYVCGTRVG